MKYLILLFTAATAIAFTNAPERGMVHMEGAYLNKKGTKDRLSCFGSNVGYLTTDEGKRIAVCFDRLQGSETLTIDCDPIWVEGHYEEKKIGANEGCQAGSMNILYVDRWSCL